MAFFEDCLVCILTPDGATGTGFLVSENLILTCAHVVATADGVLQSEPVQCFLHKNGKKIQASALPDYWSPPDQDDIAVLQVLTGGISNEVHIPRLGKTLGIEGHPCVTVGYPSLGDTQGIEGRGQIYRLISESHGRRLIQLTSKEITAGFSGAPLFDQSTGRVVGMITKIANPDRFGRLGEVAFATPSEAIHKFLLSLITDLQLHPPQAVEDYLAAVRDYCASLPYLTLHIRPPKTLDEVYVPLKTRKQPRKEDVQRLEKGQHSGSLSIAELANLGWFDWIEALSIVDVMSDQTHQHVLILGEPGSGKSTLLRWMAEQAWDSPKEIGLNRPHLPLLLPLSRLGVVDGALEDRFSHAQSGELALLHDLPQGYFTDWPEQTEAPWLIMLDAVDEVPSQQRARLMDWLRRTLKGLEGHRVIITSRPTGHTTGDLDETIFGHYDLLPFTPEQSEVFARKWFPEQVDTFLDELQRVRIGTLSGTPLLLTIAAKVYYHRGALPERRSALYGQFVEHWLREAHQRGLDGELGEKLAGPVELQLARLAHLALWMTENHEPATLESLADVEAEHLHIQEDFPLIHAETFGAQFVQAMSRRSGVFVSDGDIYEFIHPTFRDFLTAWGVVKKSDGDMEKVWGQIVYRWDEIKWHDVAVFSLCVLSDFGFDVTLLVERILNIEDITALIFAGSMLIENVNISKSTVDKIIQALLSEARSIFAKPQYYLFNLQDETNPLRTLSKLRGNKTVESELISVAHDRNLNVVFRFHVAMALGDMGCEKEAIFILLEISQDEEIHVTYRLDAVLALIRLGRAEEAVPLLIAVAENHNVWSTLRVKASLALGELENSLGSSILFGLAQDEDEDMLVRWTAVDALKTLGRIDDLLNLAKEKHINTRLRYSVSCALRELRKAEEAELVMLDLANDKSADEWIRVKATLNLWKLGYRDVLAQAWSDLVHYQKINIEVPLFAIVALEELGQTELLKAIMLDNSVDAWLRGRAACALGKMGFPTEAVPVLIALSQEKTEGFWVRLEAIEALRELRNVDLLYSLVRNTSLDSQVRLHSAVYASELASVEETAQMWIDLAMDNSIDADIRNQAAIALEKLGLAEKASQVWLDLAMESDIDEQIRVRAITGLAGLGMTDEATRLWKKISQDSRLDANVRVYAILGMERLGLIADTTKAWMILAQDKWVDAIIRLRAIETLVKLDELQETFPILLSLVQDISLNSSVRTQAAEVLVDLMQYDNDSSVLPELISEKNIDVQVRTRILSSLITLGHTAVDNSYLSSIVLSNDLDIRLRVQATAALGEFEGVDDLFTLANDENVDKYIREQAIVTLGKLGLMYYIKDLRHLAQYDKYQLVRQAARRALSLLGKIP